MPRKPYNSRTDLEKLESQWKKLSGLHTREEWSAAVVRAATAAEIAANLAIRAEYSEQSNFKEGFVNSMLRWANGLIGKLDRLIKPLWDGQPKKSKHFKQLRKHAEAVNEKRNAIVHSGEFCNKQEAEAAIAEAAKLITGLLAIYDQDYVLKAPSEA
jgi:hypothetical protein